MLYGFEEDYEPVDIESQEFEDSLPDNGPFYLDIYNTCTKKAEKVEVDRELYLFHIRSEWREAKSDKSFFAHEIQESSMSQDGEIRIENLRESIDWETDTAFIFERNENTRLLRSAVSQLAEDDQDLVICLFFRGMTNTEYGRKIGTSGQAVGQRKSTILKKLKKYLEKPFRN